MGCAPGSETSLRRAAASPAVRRERSPRLWPERSGSRQCLPALLPWWAPRTAAGTRSPPARRAAPQSARWREGETSSWCAVPEEGRHIKGHVERRAPAARLAQLQVVDHDELGCRLNRMNVRTDIGPSPLELYPCLEFRQIASPFSHRFVRGPFVIQVRLFGQSSDPSVGEPPRASHVLRDHG